jgi:hypothetical protein
MFATRFNSTNRPKSYNQHEADPRHRLHPGWNLAYLVIEPMTTWFVPLELSPT